MPQHNDRSPLVFDNTDNRMFKQEWFGEFLPVKQNDQPQVETVFQKLDEVEKKIDALTSLLKFVVGNHVLINGRWVKIEEIS